MSGRLGVWVSGRAGTTMSGSDIGQCEFCHRPAVQRMDLGDGRQDMGLCSRHSTLKWQVGEVVIAMKDLRRVIIEAFRWRGKNEGDE